MDAVVGAAVVDGAEVDVDAGSVDPTIESGRRAVTANRAAPSSSTHDPTATVRRAPSPPPVRGSVPIGGGRTTVVDVVDSTGVVLGGVVLGGVVVGGAVVGGAVVGGAVVTTVGIDGNEIV